MPQNNNPDMENLNIRALRPREEPPYELIYLADESREAVADYLPRGECWIAETGEGIVGEFILLHTRPFTIELVNVAVREDMQGRGIGKAMVLRAIGIARGKGFRIMEIGTGNCGAGQIALYQKCGFRITGIDRDFFSIYCPTPIFENGIACRDMVRLSMFL